MKMKNTLKPFAIILMLTLFVGLLSMTGNNGKIVSAQTGTNPTATPDANGYIYHTVTQDDACYNIAERYETTVEQIIGLNNLDINCTIYVGTNLLVKVVVATAVPTAEPPQATEPPQETQPTQPPEDIAPEPTAVADVGAIEIVLFHDFDGNGMRTDGEDYLFDGAVSIQNRDGTVSRVGTTVTTEALAFKDLPPGDYTVSIAVPEGFNPTTTTTLDVTVMAGGTSKIDFGAQIATPEAGEQETVATQRSPLLFILGGVILLSGIGLLIYMLRSRRR